MVDINVEIKPIRNTVSRFRDLLLRAVGSSLKSNFSKFQPVVEEAIERAVISSRREFIPDNDQAAELGIGSNGQFDFNRINNAWRVLLPNTPDSIMRFSVQPLTGSTTIGRVRIFFDEEDLFNAELSNVPTPDSFRVSSIPWMRWLINGATNSSFQFTDEISPGSNSRTGAGIMIEGGVWRFPPARPFAIRNTARAIEREVRQDLINNAAEIL